MRLRLSDYDKPGVKRTGAVHEYDCGDSLEISP